MRRRLARSVSFWAENGELITFLPGDEPPADYAKLITNPAAWEEEAMAPPPPSDGSYDSMTVTQLMEAAKARDVDLQGATKKADVIARLEAADASDGS